MKKERVLIIFIFIVLTISFVSAKALKTNCSDGSKVSWDEDEIDIHKSKRINGLGIAVVKTSNKAIITQQGVIPVGIADIFIDSTYLTLSSKQSSDEITLLLGKYTVSLSNTTSTTAKISINGESKDITVDEVTILKSLSVLLIEAESIDNSSTAKLIIGSQQLSLSSTDKVAEKISFSENKTYLVELRSASDSNAIIRVSKCSKGEIQIEETVLPQQNQTINDTTSNLTEANNTEEQNTTQVSVEEARERLRQIEKANKTKNQSDSKTLENEPQKEDFFRRLINWIKRLLGFG